MIYLTLTAVYMQHYIQPMCNRRSSAINYTVPLRPLPVETELVGGAGVVALLSLRPLAIGAPVGGKRRRLDLFG